MDEIALKKAKKPRMKKVEVIAEVIVKTPEQLKAERKMYKEGKRNVKMELAFAKMAKYVSEQENSDELFVEVHVDEKAQVVVARVEYPPKSIDEEDGDVKWGISRCNKGDTWNPLLGKYLALKRAKGTKIPVRITEALGNFAH